MIPKKIHYIWLGRNKKDRASQICINSWNAILKEYEIIEWNENNLPLDEIAANNRFFACCRNYNLWAFMSDYLRLWILYHEGGIYMDTDVQVIKSFDDLLNQSVFLGYEMNDYIGTGIIGSERNNQFIKEVLDFYSEKIWKVDYYTNPIIFSNVIKENSNLKKFYTILNRNVLSPYDPSKDYGTDKVETEETYTIHWFNANWGMNRKGYVFLNTKQFSGIKRVVEIIRKNIGYELRARGFKPF